jgi:hypothetical protein
MAFVVKENEAFDPTDVRVLCVRTEVPSANGLPNLIKQLGFGIGASEVKPVAVCLLWLVIVGCRLRGLFAIKFSIQTSLLSD